MGCDDSELFITEDLNGHGSTDAAGHVHFVRAQKHNCGTSCMTNGTSCWDERSTGPSAGISTQDPFVFHLIHARKFSRTRSVSPAVTKPRRLPSSQILFITPPPPHDAVVPLPRVKRATNSTLVGWQKMLKPFTLSPANNSMVWLVGRTVLMRKCCTQLNQTPLWRTDGDPDIPCITRTH